MAKASGIGQGPAKGIGSTNPKQSLEITPEKQKARAQKGWLKRKMAAYAAANPEARATERAPNRVEIAELAQRGLPEAVQALELIIHQSRSDVARVQAFNALKQCAYGNDRQAMSVDISVNPDDLTDSELAAIIELGRSA